MRLKKFISGALTVAMAASMMCTTAFAATTETLENGDYTGTIHFHNASDPANYSMCDSIFAHEAEVKLTDDAATLTFYVAYPVPTYPEQGVDGTIKDVKFTAGEKEYTGTSDITTKAVKTFDTAGALFGIKAGDELPTQAVTVDLPRSAVDSMEAGLATTAFVNVVMNTNTAFVVKVTDLKAAAGDATETKSMEITADVAEPVSTPTYTTTVPSSTTMGALSTTKDTTADYKVNIEASNLDGTVTVTAPESGKLTSGTNTLAFSNTFGSQNIAADTTGIELSGSIRVAANDVKAAAAGNYVGTTTFTISYAAN
ncbi:MAG: hypothetical protein PHS82_08395 [Lachnospiraceae bacterium]|nr:hypothetical protein [Lachnospiraceae bacterium]